MTCLSNVIWLWYITVYIFIRKLKQKYTFSCILFQIIQLRVWFDTMLLWKLCLSIGVWIPADICLYIYIYIYITYLCLMTSLSFTDECCVDQIDDRNRFPYQICVSYYRGHPIIGVPQLPDIVWPRANLWFSNFHSIVKTWCMFYVWID